MKKAKINLDIRVDVPSDEEIPQFKVRLNSQLLTVGKPENCQKNHEGQLEVIFFVKSNTNQLYTKEPIILEVESKKIGFNFKKTGCVPQTLIIYIKDLTLLSQERFQAF